VLHCRILTLGATHRGSDDCGEREWPVTFCQSASQLPPNIPPFEHYDKRKCCGGPQDGLKWMLKMQARCIRHLLKHRLLANSYLSSCHLLARAQTFTNGLCYQSRTVLTNPTMEAG